jgi:hypothetical protein
MKSSQLMPLRSSLEAEAHSLTEQLMLTVTDSTQFKKPLQVLILIMLTLTVME